MLLKPFSSEIKHPPAEVSDILKAAGVKDSKNNIVKVEQSAAPEEQSIKDKTIETLEKRGASLDQAAMSLASALREEKTCLKASEIVFKLYGALKDAERPSVPSINITFAGNESKGLIQFLTPRE